MLTGGSANDTFTGGAGNDTIDGGAGTGDRVVFSGARANYTISLVRRDLHGRRQPRRLSRRHRYGNQCRKLPVLRRNAHRKSAQRTPADPPEQDRLGKREAGQPRERMGHRRRRRLHQHPGFRDPDQQQYRTDGRLQDRDRLDPLPHRHLSARLLWRRRRPQGGYDRQESDHGSGSAASNRRHVARADRRRKLGGFGELADSAGYGLWRLYRQAGPRGRHRRLEPYPLHRSRRQFHQQYRLPDLRHDLAGLQRLGRRQPLFRRGAGRSRRI